MPWLRIGDNSVTHPAVVSLSEVAGATSATRCEVFGFVVLAATMSAGHLTDGYLSRGTLELAGGTRWKKITAQAVEAGLLVKTKHRGRDCWRLIDDPDLLHIRPRDEVEWERARKRDASNPGLTVPVRVRDGSSCRYCNHPVNFQAKHGARRGTYDHREPGTRATVETYVVCCFSCNSARRDNRADFDDRHPLLPVPDDPLYTEHDRAFFAKHPEHIPPERVDLLKPSVRRKLERSPDDQTSDQSLSEPDQVEAEGRDGSGRVGTGRVGTGREPRRGAAGTIDQGGHT